ncbi:YqaJ viral recombinase family protein, partial [[Clostridium] scindens]|uniref:YqaJ viral recombinase family protein n=1 Tax=Clostridium scindens (strain JCM 10418 / VPI 12708) TaxID=29347 RepID=UPI00242DA699
MTGLNLNYEPEIVVDISGLTREEWLDYRKKGIGGSDVAAIMGISPFATIRDLYNNKVGILPAILEEEESNWVAKEVGHRLENLVAEIFVRKTGLKVFPV